MPPLLGAADSFNSSSATIKADSGGNNQRTLRSHSNALGPQDSVGREFDALIGGRIGVLQSDAGVGNTDHLARYLRECATLPGEPSLSNPNNTNTLDPSTFDPLSFIADPSAPDVNFFADSEFETTNSAPAFDPSTGATFAGASASPFARPGSALSHRSHHSDYSCSTTEGSYVTTDDDGDLDMMGSHASASPSPLNELGALNLGSTSAGGWGVTPDALNGLPHSIAPSAQALGSSARNLPPAPPSVGSTSSRRRSHAATFGPDDEDDKRQQRLEHRRSINRRSAQKHRLRRKEEMEDLSKQVAERDRRILELERELAVVKGNLATVMSLVQRGKQPNLDLASIP